MPVHIYQATRHHIAEESDFSHRRENVSVCGVIASVPMKETVFVQGKICIFPEPRVGGRRD
jgi:hypothetical protein